MNPTAWNFNPLLPTSNIIEYDTDNAYDGDVVSTVATTSPASSTYGSTGVTYGSNNVSYSAQGVSPDILEQFLQPYDGIVGIAGTIVTVVAGGKFKMFLGLGFPFTTPGSGHTIDIPGHGIYSQILWKTPTAYQSSLVAGATQRYYGGPSEVPLYAGPTTWFANASPENAAGQYEPSKNAYANVRPYDIATLAYDTDLSNLNYDGVVLVSSIINTVVTTAPPVSDARYGSTTVTYGSNTVTYANGDVPPPGTNFPYSSDLITYSDDTVSYIGFQPGMGGGGSGGGGGGEEIITVETVSAVSLSFNNWKNATAWEPITGGNSF